jgi:hypothetical protein
LSYILFIGKDITAVKAAVHGIIAGIPILFPIPNADGCKNSNLVCPLKSGQTNVLIHTEEYKNVFLWNSTKFLSKPCKIYPLPSPQGT